MAEQPPARRPQLSSVLLLLWRHPLAILISPLLLAGAALAVALVQEKEYTASTFVLFRDSAFQTPVLASEDAAREVTTNLELLKRDSIGNRVDARLKEPFTGGVDVSIDAQQSSLATIKITDTGPKRAALVANTYAEEYIELRRDFAIQQIERQGELVRDQLASLSSGQADRAAEIALKERLARLRVADLTPTGARQLGRAKPPTEAVSPKPLQNAAIGGLLGVALGIALAIALERRDRRVRDPRFIEQALGRPIIGRIPRSRALAKSGRRKGARGTVALPPAEAEAFRTVRANLRRQLRDQNARSVLVTSAIPREGKSTVVWNLARVEAVSGARVLLVEADMRRPVLAHSLGASTTEGLSELLAGEAQLKDLVQPIGFEDRVEANGSSGPGAIDVLFAGKPPPNPAELMDSERMQAVLEAVSESYDLVVLDTPPAVVSDAMPILDLVGGVVVVGRPGVSTDESLRELRERLERADALMLGVVVNADASRGAYQRYAPRRLRPRTDLG